MLRPEFVTNQPALKLGGWLVVADLHLGLTTELYHSGVSLPSQVEHLVSKLHDLKKITNAENLILLGDVKHKIEGVSYQESQELPEFLQQLDFEKIVIIKGNHDGWIEHAIPKELKGKVKVKTAFSIGDFYFTHGHRNANTKKKYIIIGHSQPHVMFRDRMNARYSEPVWVKGKIKSGQRLIIVPAFNELCGATLVNKDDLLGPIAKTLDKSNARVYLLDGTDLGKLKDLEVRR